MSKSTIYGLERGKLSMGPRFTAARDEKGLYTATAEYFIIRGEFETNEIQNKLKIGNSIATIVPGEFSAAWSFLSIERVTLEEQPGGIDRVDVEFTGFTDTQWDFDDDRTKVYTRNGSLVEESIFNHPEFVKDFNSGPTAQESIGFIKRAVDGTLRYEIKAASINFLPSNGSDNIVGFMQDADYPKFREWFNLIVLQGQTTYLKPQMEWTESTTGKLPLTASDFANFGYIDDPPGNPSINGANEWLFTSVTENIQKQGEGSNSYSKTWSSGNWPDKIYKKPTP